MTCLKGIERFGQVYHELMTSLKGIERFGQVYHELMTCLKGRRDLDKFTMS